MPVGGIQVLQGLLQDLGMDFSEPGGLPGFLEPGQVFALIGKGKRLTALFIGIHRCRKATVEY